jgi:hypothetical protein
LGESTNLPYSLVWSNAPAGDYLLRAVATDNAGLSYTSRPVEIFINGTGGTLNGALSPPPVGTLDLSAEGILDWAHWGLNFPGEFDHKSGVPQQIANYSVIGTNPVQQLSGYPAVFSWNDGAPTLGTNTDTGTWVPGFGNGFELTVPAASYTKTLKIYLGLFAGQGNLQAFLSDFSATAYVDTSLRSLYDNAYGTYVLNFSSPASNQTLHVRYTLLVPYDVDFGNVTLEAASLTGPPLPLPITLVNPAISEGLFTFSFSTETNRTYFIEWSASLSPGTWQVLSNIAGTGMPAFLGDSLAGLQKFYRVRIQ